MSTNLPDLDFSLLKKDPAYVLADVQSQLNALQNGAWTDYSTADPGWLFVLTAIGLAANDAMFTDTMGNECFLATAKMRESVVRLAKSRGYQVGLATPATVSVQLNCPAFNATLTISANTTWSINGLNFTCLDQIIIPAGQTSQTITLTQGISYTNTVTAPGTPWFEITVPTNIANLQVTVNGVVWTSIDTWIDPPVQTAYLRYENATNQSVKFGNNISTSRPNAADVIVITGILTDGADGNVEQSGTVAKLLTVVRDTSNNNVTNSITGQTLTAALGGADPEGTLSIRQNAPKAYAANDRNVTIDDYVYDASKVPGVTSVAGIGGENVNQYSRVLIYVIGSDPYNVSPDLLTLVQNTLNLKSVGTVKAIVMAPFIVQMFQVLTIGVDNSFGDATTVSNAALAAMNTYVNGLGIGGGVTNGYRQSIADGVVSAVEGVEYLNSTYTLKASTTSSTGGIQIYVPTNVDLTNASLVDANGVSLLKNAHGVTVPTLNLTAYNLAGIFTYVIAGLANQVVTLTFSTTTPDVLLQYNQNLVLEELTIVPELTGT